MSIGGLQAGDVVARDFRVVRPLATGAMGAVYVVEQLSTGKERALKLMSPEIADNPRARERFILEARVGSRIDSDHVVEVVTAGFDDDSGVPYLVMELLKGEPLGDLAANQGALPVAHVREILKQAGHALEQAHAQGIVHRDIKPDNLFVAESRRQGVPFTVKILDFGIAKLVAERTNEGTQPVGTPLFMAPEQTDRQGAIGPPTDVWPLGLLTFYLLTGELFWRGADSALSTLLREVVIEPIPAASERAAELGMADRLPAGFDDWFARCVDREPNNRFANGGDAVRAFDALTRELDTAETVVALPTSSGPRTGASTGALATGPTIAMDEAAVAASGGGGSTHMTAASTSDGEERSSRTGLIAAFGAVVVLGGAGAYFAFGGGGGGEVAPASTSSAATTAVASVTATATASASAAPAPLSCPEGMIKIEGGKMFMGSADSDLHDDVRPPHKVTVASYCLDRLEVTTKDYDRCVGDGNCVRASSQVAFKGATAQQIKHFSKLCNEGRADRAEHPINCVDWEMARGYCEGEGGRLPKGGARLPTEAEWEFAARGSGQRVYPWGDEAPGPKRLNACGSECLTWLARAGMPGSRSMYKGDDGFAGTAPVGSFPDGASSAGVLDLAGNVWEWTADWYGPYRKEAQQDPTGPDTGTQRAVRGGGFNGLEAPWAKPAWRWKTEPDSRSHGIGFRCAYSQR